MAWGRSNEVSCAKRVLAKAQAHVVDGTVGAEAGAEPQPLLLLLTGTEIGWPPTCSVRLHPFTAGTTVASVASSCVS